MNIPEILNKFGNTSFMRVSGHFGIRALQHWERHPILFTLPDHWIEPLRQIDISLKPSEYQQPYPEIMVQHPSGHYTLVSVTEYCDGRYLSLVHSFGARREGPERVSHITFQARLDQPGRTPSGQVPQSIEDSVREHEGITDKECAVTGPMVRVAINACLLLASHPNYRKRGDRERQLLKVAKRGPREKAKDAQQKLRLLPQYIDFVTPPTLYDSHGTPTGTTKRAHWRRGHFRNQACGPARRDRRIIFIRPTLIHRESADSGTNQIEVVGRGPVPSGTQSVVPKQGG